MSVMASTNLILQDFPFIESEPNERIRPLVDLLDELHEVVSSLCDHQYVSKPVGVIASSVGGHVRHCLDHIAALIRGWRTGRIDYDHRVRGTDIERQRIAALVEIAQLAREVGLIPDEEWSRELIIPATLASDGPTVQVSSTLGRELAFVLSHTVHHNALIGAMVRMLGGNVPERFGYAPSTLAFRRTNSCAR
jgi:uncharacterized damage-inducible protein DinB